MGNKGAGEASGRSDSRTQAQQGVPIQGAGKVKWWGTPVICCTQSGLPVMRVLRADSLELLCLLRIGFRSTRVVAVPPNVDTRDDWLVAVSFFTGREVRLLNPFTDRPVREVRGMGGVVYGLCTVPSSPQCLLATGSWHDVSRRQYYPVDPGPLSTTGVGISNARTGKMVLKLHDAPPHTLRIISSADRSRRLPQQLLFASGGRGPRRTVRGPATARSSSSSDAETLSIRLYDLKSPQPESVVEKFEGHTSDVGGLAYSPRDGLLFSTSMDKSCRVWDIREGGHCSLKIDLGGCWSASVAFDAATRSVLCGCFPGEIQAWDIRKTKTAEPTHRFKLFRRIGSGSGCGVYDITRTFDQRYVSVCDSDRGPACSWTASGKLLRVSYLGSASQGLCFLDPSAGSCEDMEFDLPDELDDRLQFLLGLAERVPFLVRLLFSPHAVCGFSGLMTEPE